MGWTDKELAGIAAGTNGIGAKTLRQGLFYELLTEYNYEIRLPEVQYYESLGMGELTALVLGGVNGGTQSAPPEAARDNTNYCPGQPTDQSELFKNMYLPIWDGGANGTPYNDDNVFAAYLYKTVLIYKEHVRFWEIWNEPGYDDSGTHGALSHGEPGNWWENDPDPCDLKIKAPIEHYVRMLRIAWDVIKTLDPNAFVCMGGPGYPSFVDAVARNTDNPAGGSVTAEYPLMGAAYFDCVAYHAFPHIDGSLAYPDLMRNSDRAAEGVTGTRDRFEAPLITRGYNGSTYPRKRFIVTEMNVPRKAFNPLYNVGSELLQRNFMIKAYVNCKTTDICQSHVYSLSEVKTEQLADYEFELMGLYKNIDNLLPSQVQKTQEGVSASTCSDLLSACAHDPARSAQLAPGTNVRAEAFVRPDGKYIYVLWAKTLTDNSEASAATYSFPNGLSVGAQLTQYEWDWSETQQTSPVANYNIALNGSPIFLLDDAVPTNTTQFTVSDTNGCVPMTVQFANTSANGNSVVWSFPGGNPTTSSSQNPVVSYALPGDYDVSLSSDSGAGGSNSTLVKAGYIHVGRKPITDFTYFINGLSVAFYNGTPLADGYFWDFGDGQTSTDTNPTHLYLDGGDIAVALVATNACGATSHTEILTLEKVPTADFWASERHGCIPFTVQFSSAASANTSVVSWSFPGGTPSASNETNPVVTYNTVGEYNVLMTVANAVGNDAEVKAEYIRVEDHPSANFATATDHNTAIFSNTSVGGSTYTWDFGDGQSSMIENPAHTYASEGAYQVTLVAENLCSSSTFSQNVNVVTTPVANFVADAQAGCIPFEVHYTNTSQANLAQYEWSFPGGTPSVSSLPNPVVTYQQPGTFSAVLTVGNPAGSDSELKDNFVTVGYLPTASFSKTIAGRNVSFTNFSNNGDTYTWDFGDGQTSALANPQHLYANDGVFTVVLTVSNECGFVGFVDNVVIISPPQATFSANVQSGCAPLSVQFKDDSQAFAATYNWTFPGGTPSFSTEQNPLVTYAQNGAYDVKFEVANAAGYDTHTEIAYITANGQPLVGFYGIGSGLSVAFTNVSNDSDEFLWDFGDGQTSTDANPTHLYANYGDYTVTMTAIGPCGTKTFSENIVVSAAPQAAFTTNSTVGCAPFTVQFSNASSSNVTALVWAFPGGVPPVSSLPNPIVTYFSAGTYDVSLSVSNADGIDTELRSDYIHVGQPPQAGFTQTTDGPQVEFLNTSTGATFFLWDFGDGQMSTETNPTHEYAANGAYIVKLLANNDCGGNIAQQTVQIVVLGAETADASTDSFRMYPNPAKGGCSVVVQSGLAKEGRLVVMNALGQTLANQTFDLVGGKSEIALNTGNWPAGLYRVGLEINGSWATKILSVINRE